MNFFFGPQLTWLGIGRPTVWSVSKVLLLRQQNMGMTESFEMSPYWTELICQILLALVQGQEALKKNSRNNFLFRKSMEEVESCHHIS